MEFWTRGLLRSTMHRVVFPRSEEDCGKARYSMAYFCHPINDVKLEVVPSEIVRRRKTAWASEDAKDLTAKQHLDLKLAATYGLTG
jgi:isopenicillin N synthase-like dioxygenase